MGVISDPDIRCTLRVAMRREIRELKRIIRAVEKDGGKPSEFLQDELKRAEEAYRYVGPG